jgi:hypothetical protein
MEARAEQTVRRQEKTRGYRQFGFIVPSTPIQGVEIFRIHPSPETERPDHRAAM